MVSAVTLQDILGPFDSVDYVESDIQQSEILVFPPSMQLLKRKVRRVHIGTHGRRCTQRCSSCSKGNAGRSCSTTSPTKSFQPLGRVFDQ